MTLSRQPAFTICSFLFFQVKDRMKNSDVKTEKKENPVLEAAIGRHAASAEISCAEAVANCHAALRVDIGSGTHA